MVKSCRVICSHRKYQFDTCTVQCSKFIVNGNLLTYICVPLRFNQIGDNVFLLLSAACSSTVTLPALTSHPVSCQLADSCLSVDCCVSVSDISRNLHIRLVLDPCAYTLMIQMERYRVELDLLTYNFSKLLNTPVLFIPFRTILEVYQKVLIS